MFAIGDITMMKSTSMVRTRVIWKLEIVIVMMCAVILEIRIVV